VPPFSARSLTLLLRAIASDGLGAGALSDPLSLFCRLFFSVTPVLLSPELCFLALLVPYY